MLTLKKREDRTMKVDNSIRVPFNVDVLKKIRQSQQKKMAYL